MDRSRLASSRVLLAFCALLLASASAQAAAQATFSTGAPPLYRKFMAPQLTSAESAMAAAASVEARRAAGENGSVLLDETLYWVDKSGAVFRLEHSIYRANSDAAVEDLARNVTDFRPSSQKVYLILARTLPPGGDWLAVRPDAAFVQTPQDEADSALYSDSAELVVVFPQIRSGSVTEQIVLIEEPVFRIPGEFTARFYFAGSGWPTDLVRVLVDLPPGMAERLADTPIGQVPEKTRLEGQNGRTRFEWRAKNIAPWRSEPSAEPLSVSGPVVWLTTLTGWDQLADWYRGLLQGRDELPAELQQKIDEWTLVAETPEEIAQILGRHVADDIRYTGLEFGIAGFQPKTPAEVWHNGYGDCKDKANLLRAMLAAKGIPATLALIQTDRAGGVETRSPDFRHFNHAILAIENGRDGSYLWVDPTLPFLDPGQLGSGDGERLAFLILPDKGWRFATTPAAGPARLEALADVRLGQDGGLEGTLSFEADRFYSSAYRRAFQGDERERLRVAGRMIGKFFEQAEVIDLEIEETPRGLFRAKIFFSAAGVEPPASGEQVLLARDGDWLETSLDQDQPRRSSFFQVREQVRVRLRWQLPPGLAPHELPAPFAVDTPALRSRGAWTCDPLRCEVELRQEVLRAQVPAGDFAAFLQAKKAFDGWLRRPLHLAPGAVIPTSAPPPSLLEDFALMPTGSGQLRLLERKYPAGHDDALRRAALEQIVQWFPGDKETLFTAKVWLADLDCEAPDDAEANGRGAGLLRAELARYEGTLPVSSLAWGRYLLAACSGLEREEAIALLRRNDDPGIDTSRRAWSLMSWAEKMEENSPAEAAALAERALAFTPALPDDEDLVSFAWALRMRNLAKVSEQEELQTLLEKALAGEHQVKIASRLARSAYRLDLDGEKEAGARLYSAFEKVAARHAELAPVMAETRQLFSAGANAGKKIEIAHDLAELFTATPPPWWAGQTIESSNDFKVVAQKLGEIETSGKMPQFVRQAVDLLTRFPPAENFSHRLYQVVWCFHEHYPDAPQVEPLLALISRLPKSDDYYWEGQVMAGERLSRNGKSDEAIRLFERQLADGELLPDFKPHFAMLLAGAELDAGHLALASRHYAEFASKADGNLSATADGLLRATLIELENGQPEQALRFLHKLQQVDPSVIDKSKSPDQVRDLIDLGKDENRAREVWASADSWWPLWLELEEKLGLPPEGRPLAPLLGDFTALGRKLVGALQNGDSSAATAILRELAYAARWQPGCLLEFSGATTLVAPIRPELAASFHEMAIAAHRAVPSWTRVDQEARSYLLLAGHLFAVDRAPEAFAPLDAMLRLELEGELRPRGLIVLASVAALTGTRGDEAVLELSRLLEDSCPSELRGAAVTSLAVLYGSLGRHDEERRLLEREIVHPAIQGSKFERELSARLEKSRRGGNADAFTQAFTEWQARFEPKVLAYAEPTSLDDPRLQGKEKGDLIKGDWLNAEKVKIAFLAAVDTKRSVEERADLLADVLVFFGSIEPQQPKFRQMFEAMIEEPRFPPRLRAGAATWLGALRSITSHLGEADALLERQDLHFHPYQREYLLSWRETGALIAQGPAAIERHLVGLLAGKVSKLQATQFEHLWTRLLLLGDEGVAERFESKLDNLSTVNGKKDAADELRFSTRRQVLEVAEARRSLEALRGLLLTGKETPSRPSIFEELTDSKGLVSFPSETCRDLLLYDLVTLEAGFVISQDWTSEFLGCLEGIQGSGTLMRDVLLTTIDALSSDQKKADLLFSALMINPDDPVWPSLLEGLRQRIDPARDKKTWETFRVLELKQALRHGLEVDWDTEARVLSGMALTRLHYLHTEILLRDHDIPGAKAFLAGLSATELQSRPGMHRRVELVHLISAAGAASPEAKLIEASARRILYESQLDALSYGSSSSGWLAIQLARALDGKASYESAWFEAVLAGIKNEAGRKLLQLVDAQARQDWKALYQAAKELIAIENPDHDDQWYLGHAAFELGKKVEAQKALKLFLETAKGSPEQYQARELLTRLENGKT